MYNIIHIMQDGAVKSSIEGMTIKSEQFYRVLNEILKKENENDLPIL